MEFVLESKRKSLDRLAQDYPGAAIIDVTSRAARPWVRFSPFYPHGAIPVPLSPGHSAASVEGIWQGLKVFAGADIDPAAFANTSMRGLKRTARANGPVLGHRAGVGSPHLLAYRAARYQIYLPAYRWVLEHCLGAELEQLRGLAAGGPVVLLDYETNPDPDDVGRPLSHAALIIRFLADQWPAADQASRPG